MGYFISVIIKSIFAFNDLANSLSGFLQFKKRLGILRNLSACVQTDITPILKQTNLRNCYGINFRKFWKLSINYLGTIKNTLSVDMETMPLYILHFSFSFYNQMAMTFLPFGEFFLKFFLKIYNW